MSEATGLKKRLAEAGKGKGAGGMVAFLLKWLALGSLVGALAGTASALFLWSLELATETRLEHSWLLFLLPAAGFSSAGSIGSTEERRSEAAI